MMQVGQFGGFQQELEGLKRDKSVLMMELVRMRQAQQVRGRRCSGEGESCRAGTRMQWVPLLRAAHHQLDAGAWRACKGHVRRGATAAPCMQTTEQHVRALQDRLSVTEQRQQALIGFFASALKDPRILQRLFSTMSTAGVQRLGPPVAGARLCVIRGSAA